jgi:hypothetical protein
MAADLVVPHRFHGPPASGNGGWCAGALAGHLPAGGDGDGGAVQVRLHRPPPLAVPMPVVADAGGAVAQAPDGAGAVLTATRVEADLAVVDPVDLATAQDAAGRYDGLADHPFPTCFVCGPDRLPGDGLRLTPGWLDDRPEETACAWVPDDTADLAQTWAAMDCPGGWSGGLAGRPMVLGTMTARVLRPAAPGERCVVTGRHLGTEGRKTRSAATLWSVRPDAGGDPELLATAEHVWIAVDPATFGA